MSLTTALDPADADAPTDISHWAVPILLVDDDSSKRLALKAVLAPLGYHIVEAESGADALRSVGAGAIRMVPMIDMHRQRLHARYLRRRVALVHVCEATVGAASRDQRSMIARRRAVVGALPLAVLVLPFIRRHLP